MKVNSNSVKRMVKASKPGKRAENNTMDSGEMEK